MIYHLQGGFEGIQFQSAAEHADFNRICVREVDRRVAPSAGILRVVHLLGRGEADTIPRRPAIHLGLGAAAEPQQFRPEFLDEVQQPRNRGFLLLVSTTERQAGDMNVQAASSCRMAEIAHALRLAEDFRPRHFVQVILERHWMGNKLQAFIQAAVRFDVEIFCVLVRDVKQLLRVAVYRAAVVDFEFNAEMTQTFAVENKGCEQAGKDLGAEVDVQGATSETAYDEQLSMIETVLNASGTDAMVVAPLQSETVATQIANAEIPIIAIDTNVESDKVLSFVGFDNEAMASMGGEAAVEAAKEAGWDTITAIGIAGVQGDSTSEARMGGYKAGVEKAGGTYLDAETQYADGVSDKAVTAMEAIIQSHPEGIAIVVCNNDDMAVGAARAAASYPAYKNTIFVGCGGNVAALDAILAGQETMTVAVDGYDVGYRGVQAAVDALNGKTLDKFIASTASIVTADNAEEQKAIVEKKQNG